MTIITYFPPNRDDESVASSSWEESQRYDDDDTVEEDDQASSSVYTVIGKKIRSWIRRKPHPDSGINNVTTIFSYSELKTATGNFTQANKIAEDLFGTIYKGTLPDKREIAAKRMNIRRASEFISGVSILSALQHPNIVKLYGCCDERKNKITVYEYLKNGSLNLAISGESHLHLDWMTRYNICLGTARGLAYLHEEANPRVIHRDFKPTNILLDMNLNPKISDFDLAVKYDNTPIETSCIIGTYGYMPPEYAIHGHLSEKFDVYTFGVVVLVILSGRKPSLLFPHQGAAGVIDLLSYAWNLYENNHETELVDPRVSSFNKEEACRMLQVALLCIQDSPLMRPPMSEVVAMLRGQNKVTPVVEKPFYVFNTEFDDSRSFMNEDGSSRSAQQIRNYDELSGVNNGLAIFSYAELRMATGDFCPVNKLGQGGFGPVYKGTLADGREIAVKKLLVSSPHGESQFVAEISTISALQHCNLAKLYGCCIEEENRLLVYQYLVNKSLDQALFGSSDLHLDWTTRYNICLGVSRVLAYFHEESNPRIIHRDVKSSNILLDIDMNPKISDLGLSRLYDDKKSHMTTKVGGTIGYVAPEYALCGRLTEKADVFGFGVVALEVLCGRPVIDSRLGSGKDYLPELAWRLYETHRSLELVDQRLTDFNKEEAIRLLGVALLCTQASPKLRPQMSQVVAMLTGDDEVTPVTEKPKYLIG